ncbi:bacteriorhodopsin [Sphingomonas sp. H160509]|nr:bacteriorhodopsin [Sphingomonas sp. H160509]MDD1452154.1 bacteriorhodopsin [Sphingomonas sp. H160509]
MARYVDWSVTTPILLAGLVLLAFQEHGKTGEVGGYLTSVIVLDVLMIVTGLIFGRVPDAARGATDERAS